MNLFHGSSGCILYTMKCFHLQKYLSRFTCCNINVKSVYSSWYMSMVHGIYGFSFFFGVLVLSDFCMIVG